VWARFALALVSAAALATGCDREARTPDSPETALQAPGDAATCGTPSLALTQTSLFPDDARSVALFDLRDPDLDAARARLGAARDPAALGGLTLPIVVAADVAQWSLELQALELHLDRAGLRPRHAARALTPSGTGVWIIPSDCDLLELRGRASRAWSVTLRQTAEGWVGTPDADSPSPWGLIALPGDRLAFAAPSALEQARGWLGEHRPAQQTYSARLWRLPSSAIRFGLRTGGLRQGAEVTAGLDPLQPLFFVAFAARLERVILTEATGDAASTALVDPSGGGPLVDETAAPPR